VGVFAVSFAYETAFDGVVDNYFRSLNKGVCDLA